MINFNIIESIKQVGFVGFRTIASIQKDYSILPKIKGAYLIVKPDSKQPKFLEIGSGGHFKGRNPNVPIDTLHDNWVDESMVVYIGKAGGRTGSATLHSRLKQYFNFGQCKPVGHWGGRFIWQLRDSGSLIVCWKPLPDREPREYESKLIQEFISQYGQLPFANLVK